MPQTTYILYQIYMLWVGTQSRYNTIRYEVSGDLRSHVQTMESWCWSRYPEDAISSVWVHHYIHSNTPSVQGLVGPLYMVYTVCHRPVYTPYPYYMYILSWVGTQDRSQTTKYEVFQDLRLDIQTMEYGLLGRYPEDAISSVWVHHYRQSIYLLVQGLVGPLHMVYIVCHRPHIYCTRYTCCG